MYISAEDRYYKYVMSGSLTLEARGVQVMQTSRDETETFAAKFFSFGAANQIHCLAVHRQIERERETHQRLAAARILNLGITFLNSTNSPAAWGTKEVQHVSVIVWTTF